ncbi:MAG: transporter permease, partial [Phycisphaerales bacterium]|nr:transporter permease [Phycisphaerales bacterium]
IALMSGIYAARKRGGLWDRASGSLYLALYSFPSILAGVLLIGFFADVNFLHWFPTGSLHDISADKMAFLPRHAAGGFERGWVLDSLWHLLLPVVCLTYGGFAFISKLTRSAVLENLAADYARTARAKGVDDHTVLFVHVVRNSLLPLITVAASILPGLIAGSVIVESIFSVPGMGRLAVEAVQRNDRELVLASTLVGGVIGLLSYLLSDLCYAIADPRVSYE